MSYPFHRLYQSILNKMKLKTLLTKRYVQRIATSVNKSSCQCLKTFKIKDYATITHLNHEHAGEKV